MSCPLVLAFVVTFLVTITVADFYIYRFEVRGEDGDVLSGWQFLNETPSCVQVEEAEMMTTVREVRGQIRVVGSSLNPMLIEWHNSMGHYFVFKADESSTEYGLSDLNANIYGFCQLNTTHTWQCDWDSNDKEDDSNSNSVYNSTGKSLGKGTTVMFCTTPLTAPSAHESFGGAVATKEEGVGDL